MDKPSTTVDDETWTVLAIGPDASKRVDLVTGGLKLYTDPVRAEAAELKDRLAKAEQELEELRAAKARVVRGSTGAAGGHSWW
eukprot:Skav230464  [mRNA]  locus=scaffold186:232734:234724:+ [translate_table: standard]